MQCSIQDDASGLGEERNTVDFQSLIEASAQLHASEQPLSQTRINLWQLGEFVHEVPLAGQVNSLHV